MKSVKADMTIGLVGNPNCGKSTVFNALTSGTQRIGNWPGVTVERKSGYFSLNKTIVEVVDLPGIYSLTSNTALDEQITTNFITQQQVDLILNIVDASHLERQLYLTTQLLEMGIPVLIGLNMMDVVKDRGMQIRVKEFAKLVGCSVVLLSARRNEGIEALKKAIVEKNGSVPSGLFVYPELIREAVVRLKDEMVDLVGGHASLSPLYIPRDSIVLRLLEGDTTLSQQVPPTLLELTQQWQTTIATQLGEDADILIADARYRFIQTIMQQCVTNTKTVSNWTARLDAIILHRGLGIPIFLLIMYALFFFAINVGGAFQDFFDISSNTIFVDGLGYSLSSLNAPHWLIILAKSIGNGMNTVITFIPVIAAMFLGLAFLEDSGYMARAAFIADRLMRTLGLPGKSFVPMIVGFGCNVPAVMAARTLENPRDRILTVMMTPFMSCSARLAIYAAFTAAFFPTHGSNIVFGLYLTGILFAVLTGWVLRKTVLQGDPVPFVMELPAYHWPKVRTLFLHAWQRLNGFVLRAGKLILPLCIILSVLNIVQIDGTLGDAKSGGQYSLLAIIGQWITPIFSPMGIHQDNWPAAVGLLTGVLAKEVVVGSLNALYGQVGQLISAPADVFHFWGSLQTAVLSIPTNLAHLGGAIMNPLLAKAPVHSLNPSAYGIMAQHFDGTIGAIAYLLFVLLYFPCVSTVAVMWRELGRYWAGFSVLWTTSLAYAVAVIFYQLGSL
jgi:ferrous iron transport protein B